MEGLHGLRTPSRRAAIKQAVKISSHLIETVENVILAREAPSEDLLCSFATQAGDLVDALSFAEQSLSMELEFFRDITIGANGDGVSAFTSLGFPVRDEPGEPPHVDPGLAVSWCRIYRRFHCELQAASQAKTRCDRRGGAQGGRPKDPDVVRFEKEIAVALAEGFDHHMRNGCDRKGAVTAMKNLMPGDLVRRVNEKFGRNYPLHGSAWEAIRKRVERAPAYRSLKELDLDWDDSEEELQVSPKRDACWAMEINLSIRH